MNAKNNKISEITTTIEKIISDLIYIYEELKHTNEQDKKADIHTIFTVNRKILGINEKFLDVYTQINLLSLMKKNRRQNIFSDSDVQKEFENVKVQIIGICQSSKNSFAK